LGLVGIERVEEVPGGGNTDMEDIFFREGNGKEGEGILRGH